MFYPENYTMTDLTNFDDTHFPLVISVETIYPPNYQGKAKRTLEYTYASMGNNGSSWVIKPLKQKFIVSNLNLPPSPHSSISTSS